MAEVSAKVDVASAADAEAAKAAKRAEVMARYGSHGKASNTHTQAFILHDAR